MSSPSTDVTRISASGGRRRQTDEGEDHQEASRRQQSVKIGKPALGLTKERMNAYSALNKDDAAVVKNKELQNIIVDDWKELDCASITQEYWIIGVGAWQDVDFEKKSEKVTENDDHTRGFDHGGRN